MRPIRDIGPSGQTPALRAIETIENFLAGGYTTSDQEEHAAMEAALALDRLRDWVDETYRPFQDWLKPE